MAYLVAQPQANSKVGLKRRLQTAVLQLATGKSTGQIWPRNKS